MNNIKIIQFCFVKVYTIKIKEIYYSPTSNCLTLDIFHYFELS